VHLRQTDSTDLSQLSYYTTPGGTRIAEIDTQGDETGGAVVAWVIIAGYQGFTVNPAQFIYKDGSFTDAGIAEPALKTVSGNLRYVVCLRFNAKKRGTEYAGTKELSAVFVAGRFDRFAEIPKGEHDDERGRCAGAAYAAFPELEKLTR